MPELKTSRLTGRVIEIGKGRGHEEGYWVDIGLKTIDGHFVNVNYSFSRESVRDNIFKHIKPGMTITVSVKGQGDLNEQFDFQGIGSLQIQNLSSEQDCYVRRLVQPLEDGYFSENEVTLINQMMGAAKDRIRETFEPNEEQMAMVEENLDSLARQSRSVTKYNWGQLFWSCILSVSIDLGFGESIPETLLNLFKKLVEEFIQYQLPSPQG